MPTSRGRREKGDGSIRERKPGQFQVRYTVPLTGEQRSFTASSYQEARDELHRRLTQVADGTLPPKTGKLTVAEYLEGWLETTARLKLDENVWKTYRGYLHNHVNPVLGKVLLAKLTADQVERFLASRLAPCGPHQRPLAPRTILQIQRILSSAFKPAVRKKLMPSNLAREAEHPRIERHNPTFLTPEEAALFVAALPGHRLGTIYAVALGCGLRLGETLGVCWEDLNLATGDLVVNHQLKRVTGAWKLTEAKRDSARTVTLPPIVLELLQAHRRAQLAADAELPPPVPWRRLVFRRPEGLPYHEEFITRTLQKLTPQLGLPAVTFHELRHSAASLLIKSGVGLKEVSEFLGHSSVGITGDHYAHLYQGQSQENALQMQKLLTPSVPHVPHGENVEYVEYAVSGRVATDNGHDTGHGPQGHSRISLTRTRRITFKRH